MIMSTGNHRDPDPQQLHLFGGEAPAEVVNVPSVVMELPNTARSGLRLVSSSATVQRFKVHFSAEDPSGIEARLIGRAKFF